MSCAICGNHNATACKSCKSAFYCSKECKTRDSELHNLLCSKYAKVSKARHSPHDILVVYFPADSRTPKLLWTQELQIVKLMDRGNPTPVPIIIPNDKKHKRGVIVGLARPEFWYDRHANTNLSIMEITKGDYHFPWRGPMVCAASDHADGDLESISLNDLPVIVEHFKSWGKDREGAEARGELKFTKAGELWEASFRSDDAMAAGASNTTMEDPQDTVRGVIVLCVGESKILGGQKYMEIEVPKKDIIFEKEPTQISQQMKLPILLRKCDMAKSKIASLDFKTQNMSASYLTLNMDPGSEKWGFAPMPQWTNGVGDVLIVREDMKDITMHQAEALSRFCQHVISPAIADGREDGWSLDDDEELRLMNQSLLNRVVTQSKFEKFFARHRKDRIKGGLFEEELHEVEKDADSSWAGAVSPYSI